MGMSKKVIIGRVEQATFPILQLSDVTVKIDTGAYHSSIHCSSIREEDGQLYCQFGKKDHSLVVFQTYHIAMVKSSNGQTELRYKIVTPIQFGEKTHSIALTLTDRQEMRYPVLIGRKFLKKKYLVDVSFTHLLK